MNREGKSMLDINGHFDNENHDGKSDYDGSLETKTAEQVKRDCLLALDNLLGKGNYTVSENGDVMPTKEVSAKIMEEVEAIEFDLRGATNVLNNHKT